MKPLWVYTQIVVGMVFIGVGLAIGFIVAMYSVKLVIYVDFDSGAHRQKIKVGPFTIRDSEYDLRSTVFHAFPLKNGDFSLTGNPQWYVVSEFHTNSRVSPNTLGGDVAYAMACLEALFPLIGKDRAAEIKELFLRTLAENGVDEACLLGGKLQVQITDELYSQRNFQQLPTSRSPVPERP